MGLVNFSNSLMFHLAPPSGQNLNLYSSLVYLSNSLVLFTVSTIASQTRFVDSSECTSWWPLHFSSKTASSSSRVKIWPLLLHFSKTKTQKRNNQWHNSLVYSETRKRMRGISCISQLKTQTDETVRRNQEGWGLEHMVIIKAFNKVQHLIKSFNYNLLVQNSRLKKRKSWDEKYTWAHWEQAMLLYHSLSKDCFTFWTCLHTEVVVSRQTSGNWILRSYLYILKSVSGKLESELNHSVKMLSKTSWQYSGNPFDGRKIMTVHYCPQSGLNLTVSLEMNLHDCRNDNDDVSGAHL